MTHRPIDSLNVTAGLGADAHLVEIGRILEPLECWVVGGWVRDRALDRKPPDLDLVVNGTDAAQEAARRISSEWRTKPRLLGKPERAVWRLTGPRCKVEIWPMASDDLRSDALRRDFTCNALFWRLPNGPLIDFAGAIRDLTDQRIRAISKANLIADPVRLLRGVRLLATLKGFSLDPQTGSWIAALAPTLAGAPRERVGAELLLLAKAPRAVIGIREGFALGLLAPAGPRPSLTAKTFTADMDALARLAGEGRHPVPAAVEKNRHQALLAWLASGWPASSLNRLTTFAWPKDLAGTVAIAASRHQEAGLVVDRSPAERRVFMAGCGRAFPTVFALAAANDVAKGGRHQPWRRWWRQWSRSGQAILEATPLLEASEITATFPIEPGPHLGRILRDLKRAAVRREIRTPEGARRWLRRYLAGASSEDSGSP